MLFGAIRSIAFMALLSVVALAVPGVGSLIPPAGAPIVALAPDSVPPAVLDRPPPQLPATGVALSAPVRLLIPSLNIDAQIEALGMDSSGAMETPQKIWNVGWYSDGPSPGGLGDAVIDGHVGLPGTPLVFGSLPRLTLGAEVITVLADGTHSKFTVSGLRRWPATSYPGDLFSGDGDPRLSLITCTGLYDNRTQTYGDRLIVEAGYVGPA
jgi:Sortase domain